MKNSPSLPRRKPRGVALLLVMIGLIVCTLLTAGFLSSQGTSIGIARNERDAERARATAQSGIDLCYYLVRNRTDWRTAMTPGTWLSNFVVGDGTVTVRAASADGGPSFATDTTLPVVFTSTGIVNNRAFTLTATIGPTGGGTVFRGGNFCKGHIVMGAANPLSGAATIDSYNSSVAAYNPTLPGSNAIFGTAMGGDYGLLVYSLSTFRGAFVGSDQQTLANAVYSTLGATGPVSISIASQPYTPGRVIVPNTADLPARGAVNKNMNYTLPGPGIYDSFLSGPAGFSSTTITINTSGIYRFTGNVNVQTSSSINITDGTNAIIIVDGSLSLSGNLKLSGSATLDLYVDGALTMGSSVSINLNGNTNAFTLLGTGAGDINMNGTSSIYGSVYAPNSAIYMQGTAPKVFGAIVSNTLTMLNNAAFHFDEKLKDKRIDNITAGSAPAGTAIYNVNVVGSVSLGSN